MKTEPTLTAVVIDFKAAKRAMKRKQQSASAPRRAVATTGGHGLSFDQRQRRDEVRIAAKARI